MSDLYPAVCLFVTTLLLTAAVEGGPPIDLRTDAAGGIVTLSQPDAADQPIRRRIDLPKFEKACFFAPDAPAFRWIGASNRMLPWMADDDLRVLYDRDDDQNPAVPPPNRRGLFLLLRLDGGDYMALLALAGPYSCGYLQIEQDGSLIAGYSTAGTKRPARGPIPLLAWARDADVYTASAEAWRQAMAMAMPEAKGRVRPRGQKTYPEVFEYLGWCSWEQFHHNINQRVLTRAVDEIDASEAPVRWLLVDDGHQTDRGKSLVSLKPDPKKFPDGWEPLLAKRRPDGVRWMGVWHCLLGQWDCIAADHQMPWLEPYMTPISDKPNSPLAPKVDPEAAAAFYDVFIERIKATGFDFMKIDNMSRATLDYQNLPNAARAEWLNAHELDKAAHRHDLPFIACSSQNAICMLNTWHCATMRCSIDYRRNKPATAKSHVYQSFANTLWMGQTLWPDHDMFHSSDASCGELMAVTKAMSGGPVYLSDQPRDFRIDFILPLCDTKGKLLRPLAPGAPLPASALCDAMNDDSAAYQVAAPLTNGAVAVAGFNLVHPTPDKPVPGHFDAAACRHAAGLMQPRPTDRPAGDEGVIVYDWRAGTGRKLTDAGIDYAIEGFDYRLYLLCPIQRGWAVIGRADKYLAPAAVTNIDADDDTLTFTLDEAGPAVIYSHRGAIRCQQVRFKPLGNGFWRADLPIRPEPITLTIQR